MDLRDFGLSDDDLRQLGYKVGGDAPQGDRAEAEELGDGGRTAAAGSKRRRLGPELRVWLATLLVLPLVAWAASLSRRVPDPVPAAAPDTAFSSARALAQLVELAQRPHPTGSPDLVRVRSAILGRLSALGLSPQVQVTTSYVRDSSLMHAATVRNVVVRLPGSGSTGAVAVLAHYDAAAHSPGAGDNALGVSAVLEAVRALSALDVMRNDLILVFTDADEVAQLGSRAFMLEHPWAEEVAMTVSVESRGASGPALLFEDVGGNALLMEALAASSPGRSATSLARALQSAALESRDALPAGTRPPFAALTVLGGRGWEDQVRDVRELVDEGTLQHTGEQLLALLRVAGELDLSSDLEASDQLYFSLPRFGLIQYPSGWNLFVSLGLVVVWALMALVVHLRRGGRNGLIAGLLVGAGAVGLSALASRSLVAALGGIHSEYGLLETAFYRDAPHALALVALSLAITTALYGLARWWCRWDEVLLGVAVVPLAWVVWLSLAEPAAAPSAQWALALSLVASTLITVLGPRRGSSAWTWGVVLLLTSSALVLVVPSLELTTSAWTLRRATELGALFGLLALLLAPMLDWLRRPRAVATPLFAALVSALIIALYLPAVQGAVDHPEPTTLVYLTDQEAEADPILRGAVDSTGARTVVGSWLTVPGPGEEWARSWVGDPPTGSMDAGILLLGVDDRYQIAGTAPDAEIARPTITVVASEVVGGFRSVSLDLRSGLRGEMTGVVVSDTSGAELIGVGDTAWPVGGVPIRRLVHWGVPEGGALRLGLSLPAAAGSAEVVVIEHHLRPREVLGDYFFQRPDSLIAAVSLGSDRAIQRTIVRVDVSSPVGSGLDGEQPPGGERALEPTE